jgi:MFS family permease
MTAIIVRPFAGFLLDRYGRRVWQLSASALFASLMFAHVWALSFGALMLVRLLQGLSWGMIGIASATLAADLAPLSRRGTALGYYGLAMPLALALGPVLGALFLLSFEYSALFVLCALLAVAALFCFYVGVHGPQHGDRSLRFRPSNIYDLRVSRLFLFMLSLCVAYGAWVSLAPLFARELGMQSSAPLFTVYATAVLSTRAWGGRSYDKRGPKPSIVAGLFLLFCGWLSLGLWGSATGAVLGAVGVGLGFGLIMPSFNAMAMDLVEPSRRGAANALVFSAYDLGISLGAVGLGFLSEHLGLRLVFLLAAGLTVVAAVQFRLSALPHFLALRRSTR